MNLSRSVSKAAQRCVIWTIQSVTCSFNSSELLNDFTGTIVEAFGSAGVIGTDQDQILAWNEFCAVNKWIYLLRVRRVPVQRFERLSNISEVPELNSFTSRTSTCDHKVHVSRNVYRVSAYLNSTNTVCHFVRSYIPEFYVLVPTAGIH